MNEKKRCNIGVLIGNVHTHHPKELIRGINEAAKDRSVNLFYFLGTQSGLFCEEQGEGLLEGDYDYQYNTVYDFALLGKMDALIIAYGTLCIFLEDERKETFFDHFSNIPHIVLEEREERADASYLISDNYNGMMHVMDHLIEVHGYRKIAHLSGPIDNSDATERRTAYLHAMQKHNIPVKDTMITYGNYSEFVEAQTYYMLDQNPGLEAICCANDEMALGVYRALEKRGLVIGEDIAVTGYDDFELAQSMDPPLTTADQNGYDMGYRALVHALKLYADGKCVAMRLPAKLMLRNSCGCKGKRTYRYFEQAQDITKGNLIALSDRIAMDVALNKENEAGVLLIKEKLYIIIDLIYQKYVLEKENTGAMLAQAQGQIMDHIREIIGGAYGKFVSTVVLSANLSHFLQEMISFVDSNRQKAILQNLLLQAEEFIHSYVLLEKEQEYMNFQRKTWLSPLFARSLMETVKDEKMFFYRAVKEIKSLGIQSAFVYLLEKPIRHKRSDKWECPKAMYLAAYSIDEEVHSFDADSRLVITKENGFASYINPNRNNKQVVFTLFAGEIQYGVLMCEMEGDEIPAMYVISLQLGTALRFLDLSRAEFVAQVKLQDSLRTIEEKNEVLSFISSYDELTGLLNRRGFMEKALACNRENEGSKACVLFCDLDHLKEINDCFGHAEGDYAIKKVGQFLRRILGGKGVIGRIGGDEEVAIILEADLPQGIPSLRTQEDTMQEIIRYQMKMLNKEYNDRNEKPYYIECSVGVQEFVCAKDCDIAKMLELADNSLYQAKKTRRCTIRR